MSITKTTDGIYKLSTNIENILFEGIWEIPNGVSLNSYIVKGEKETAIIDGFCGWDGVPDTFHNLLDEMDVSIETVDYIIINHMEPDHSGWIENIRKIKEDVKIICTKASMQMLEAFYGHTDNVQIIKNGDSIDLGNRVLEFYTTPNVHWPDTMVTFDTKSGTLFSCDAFGAFGNVYPEKSYDDQLTEEDIKFYEDEALRYYSNIVGAFSIFVTRAIEKCAPLPIKIVAPGHGIVWRKNPEKIINDYVNYANYQKGPATEKIAVFWGSMYGMTEAALSTVTATLEEAGMAYDVHNVVTDSWGTIITAVWDATGVILAMPTYENKMFPPMAAAIEEMGKKQAKNRVAFRLGSYGWGGGAERELFKINEDEKMNWTFLPSVEFKGAAKEDDLNLIKERVLTLVEEVKTLVNQ